MSRPRQRMLSFDALRSFVGPVFILDVGVGRRIVEGAEVRALAEHVGVTARTVQRWSAEGLPESRADYVAVKLGVHPSAIWYDWFDLAERAS